jgi:hypothetical protein
MVDLLESGIAPLLLGLDLLDVLLQGPGVVRVAPLHRGLRITDPAALGNHHLSLRSNPAFEQWRLHKHGMGHCL